MGTDQRHAPERGGEPPAVVGTDRLLLVDLDPYSSFLIRREFPRLHTVSVLEWAEEWAEPDDLVPACVAGSSAQREVLLRRSAAPTLVIRWPDEPGWAGAPPHWELMRPFGAADLRAAIRCLLGASAPAIRCAARPAPDLLPRAPDMLPRPGSYRQVARRLLEGVRVQMAAAAAVLLLDEAGGLFELATVGLTSPARVWFAPASPARDLLAAGSVTAVAEQDLPVAFHTHLGLHWLVAPIDGHDAVGGLLLLGFLHEPGTGQRSGARAAAGALSGAVRDAWQVAIRRQASRLAPPTAAPRPSRLPLHAPARAAVYDLDRWRRGADSPPAPEGGAAAALPPAARASGQRTGLMSALEDYAAHLSVLTGHEVAVDAAPEPVPIDPRVASALFDVSRHLIGAALAQGAVRVVLRAADGHLLLRVRSDGTAPAPADPDQPAATLRLAVVAAEALEAELTLTEPGARAVRYELRYPLGPRAQRDTARRLLHR